MKYIQQFLIILSISFIAELMEYFIPLPVAASIYGLVLMLMGLATKLIPLDKVEGAADFLVGMLPIIFIPSTVGIMASIEALQEMLIPLCVISVVSTFLVFGVTGRVTQGIVRQERKKEQLSVGGETMEGNAKTEGAEPKCADEDRQSNLRGGARK